MISPFRSGLVWEKASSGRMNSIFMGSKPLWKPLGFRSNGFSNPFPLNPVLSRHKPNRFVLAATSVGMNLCFWKPSIISFRRSAYFACSLTFIRRLPRFHPQRLRYWLHSAKTSFLQSRGAASEWTGSIYFVFARQSKIKRNGEERDLKSQRFSSESGGWEGQEADLTFKGQEEAHQALRKPEAHA